jgi:outer membrane translocation and assembly module TamA
VSYKFARERLGYAFGIERPVFGGPDNPRLLVYGDVHDTTSSDDFWRLSVAEQSLVALSFKNSFRDYYNERGYRIGAAFQPNDANELRASWSAARHEPLSNEADFSLFRDDESFRTNRLASDGQLRAFVFGYTLDSRGLADETGRASLRRHSVSDFFGSFGGDDPGVRLDLTSEIAREDFGSDFEFTRHIGNARAYFPFASGQRLNLRLAVGTSTGTPPPQRLFGLGGIGTVHGYAFKEAIGERMLLANAEYHLGSYRNARVIGFIDLGRVFRPVETLSEGTDWLTGLGVGFAVGDLRLDFGWRADNVPDSLQVLVRFGPTF